MRGFRFKSTPPWRPYWLPFKKSQAEVSNRLSKSVPETVDSPNHAPSGTYAPNVPETLLFDMDLDDLDDVPSARLLKKTTIPEVAIEMPTALSVSIHSQESSSTK